MTTTIGDRATVKCARCNSTVVFHDVIGTRYGTIFTLIPGAYVVDTLHTICLDCEPMEEDNFLSLAATEPVDPDNLPTGVLPGGGYR